MHKPELQNLADNGDGLCDVPIQQVYQSLGNGLEMVQKPRDDQNEETAQVPCREGRDQLWEDLGNIGHSEHLPWLCMGDFNEVLRTNDKFEGNIPSQRRLSSFHRMLNSCGLVDLGFQGPRFTWRNNRAGEDHIMERIDMAFANSKWR
ncbi:hypothetical protein RHSIM_Rhsim08G0129100 [Rhododendron simsii]|uniref:Endonuclease/exonuclease/phosphatase domain-containing protein n=1 Tax=Rhododendron simsii TaxID=118357 RepID=A0A834GND7_RHOSS|nr:hypothetical protein RHSIM_Rhsim08G0129100 [Rhododendron simsii]